MITVWKKLYKEKCPVSIWCHLVQKKFLIPIVHNFLSLYLYSFVCFAIHPSLSHSYFTLLIILSFSLCSYTRSVRKVSGLPLYLRAIVFEWPLRGMNVNSKASRTYRLLADICRTNSSCAACLCLQSYFWVRRILWLLKMIENQDQRICIKFCF